jgi:hypothetical protein
MSGGKSRCIAKKSLIFYQNINVEKFSFVCSPGLKPRGCKILKLTLKRLLRSVGAVKFCTHILGIRL